MQSAFAGKRLGPLFWLLVFFSCHLTAVTHSVAQASFAAGLDPGEVGKPQPYLVPTADLAAARRRLRASSRSENYLGKEEDQLAVDVADGRCVTPKEAIDSVARLFGEQPRVLATHYAQIASFPAEYAIEAELPSRPACRCWFSVRALNGVFRSALFSYTDTLSNPVSREEARRIGDSYLDEIYPEWRHAQWQSELACYEELQSDWTFARYRVLNRLGVLQYDRLEVSVEKETGRIRSLLLPPPIRLNGLEVPRLNRSQVKQLAASVAVFDPAVYDIFDIRVYLHSDPVTGFGYLYWDCLQREPNPEEPGWAIYVDDLTGEAQASAAIGGIGGREVPRRPRAPKITKPAIVRLQLPGKSGMGCTPEVQIRAGRVWFRPELLRLAGSRVDLGKQVRDGEAAATFAELAAEKRKGQWWVPLRRVAERFGWRIDWVPRSRTAIITRTSDAVGIAEQ